MRLAALTASVTLAVAALAHSARAHPPPPPPPQAPPMVPVPAAHSARQSHPCAGVPHQHCSFVERFAHYNLTRWWIPSGFANGEPFDSWWSHSNVHILPKPRRLVISVANDPGAGKPYSGGQLQSNFWYGYGCYEVRMKPIKKPGVVTSFYIYTGRYDAAPGRPKTHNEVDIEFVWRNGVKQVVMQSNYFTERKGGNEHFTYLPFDPSKAYHYYGFKFTQRGIQWYVDGKKVHTATRNTPKLSSGPFKIMMNTWVVGPRAELWAGTYQPGGVQRAWYDKVRYTTGENCQIGRRFS